MKKIACWVAALMLALTPGLGLGESIALKTTTAFGWQDAASETYMGLLKTWQEKTGHTVNDTSSSSDEAWKNNVLNDFAAGNEADILFFFAKTADSNPILSKVVPIHEINAAYPGLNLLESPDITEADGVVYAIPVRPFWEGLFCNLDVFEAHGLELPTTWEKLEKAIRTFKAQGIVPIAVSLSDVPHYLVEFCILAAGAPEDYMARPAKDDPIPEAWVEGMKLIRRLYEMGAFQADVNATTSSAASQLFLDKEAAMTLDGSWFANGIAEDSMDTTVVIPFPGHSPKAEPAVCITGVSMGFYLSRAAWEDDEKRDVAVDLLSFLTTGENARALRVYSFSGKLLESSEEMILTARTFDPPLQDAMDPAARSAWFAAVPGIADGTVDPVKMWQEVFAMDPFAAR